MSTNSPFSFSGTSGRIKIRGEFRRKIKLHFSCGSVTSHVEYDLPRSMDELAKTVQEIEKEAEEKLHEVINNCELISLCETISGKTKVHVIKGKTLNLNDELKEEISFALFKHYGGRKVFFNLSEEEGIHVVNVIKNDKNKVYIQLFSPNQWKFWYLSEDYVVDEDLYAIMKKIHNSS
ncbi:hypothetical protein [Acidianus hospitalis]|uniref:hypothetical protein n=1 Tax=Acidianus hospitalis TaxID=563177 RepID=UPI00064F2FAA|nr:hypothetical protein [Acidianus hospitalis]